MSTLKEITDTVINRSKPYREIYKQRIEKVKSRPKKSGMTCANLAHTVAACSAHEREHFLLKDQKNIAIVTAYNDMLSAHAPYYRYPEKIKSLAKKHGMMAQVAGGVPAMCDGVTQGQEGMDLSLFSRDIIAQASAIGLSHNVFDGTVMLGICDKIVPGLFMGAMSFGHLPTLFMPSGPMVSGISNEEKAKVRQEFAKGTVDAKKLLEVESASYSASGTCTFYGTANTNQMLMDVMGLHVPSAAFVPALSKERDEMNVWGMEVLAENVRKQRAIADIIDERSFINALVMLLATGGSTNHTLHLVAMARVCGIVLEWEDFAKLSAITPLIAKMYPNGSADVNHFHQAGGTAYVIGELLKARLLHEDVQTVLGEGLRAYAKKSKSKDITILSDVQNPFSSNGGLTLLDGNLGKAVMKTSSLKTDKKVFELKAKCFESQSDLKDRYEAGELNEDFVAVLPYHGPKAMGMPELHSLSPVLGLLQDSGLTVALITDGRMSGASGKFPAAIHVSPEAASGGVIALVQEGDTITIDIHRGLMDLHVQPQVLEKRKKVKTMNCQIGSGRELFALQRGNVDVAHKGASQFYLPGEEPC